MTSRVPWPARRGLLWLLAVLVLATAGCAQLTSAADEDARLHAVASFSVLGEVVEAVGGERVAVTTVVPVGADPHGHEPRPSDVAAISEADVTFDNGLGLNPWMEPLRSQASGPVVDAGAAVADEVATDPVGRPDPHVWLDPRLMADIGDVVATTLSDLDPEGADGYARRAAELRDELEALHADLADRVAALPSEDRLLVTHEHAFSYFADAYDFEIVATVVGTSTEEQPSAAHVRRLVDAVRRRDVAAVFPQTTVPPDVIERIADDAGARLGAPLHVDSVGEPGSDADDYAGMMRANVDILLDGLTGDGA